VLLVASSRAETPALLAGDSGLGDSPRQSSSWTIQMPPRSWAGDFLSLAGDSGWAGDSGPQGPETPVGLAGFWIAKGLDDSVTRPELGRKLLSLAGDSGPGVT
jgi:hypothetical protein